MPEHIKIFDSGSRKGKLSWSSSKSFNLNMLCSDDIIKILILVCFNMILLNDQTFESIVISSLIFFI